MKTDVQPRATVALLLRVTPEMHRRIKVTARSRGQSMSGLVQAAIRRDLDREATGHRVAQQLRRSGQP
jgi:predicted HicB family RNase H-like nuclease